MPTNLVIGIDEAGRGALAGPVVVCAAAILKPEAIEHIQLRDSKAMTKAARMREYRKLMAAAKAGVIKYSVVSKDNLCIDKYNILEATKSAAECAMWNILYDDGTGTDGSFVRRFDETFESAKILIDGNVNLVADDMPPFTNTVECIVKGDSKVPEIMAASIIAKVTRDLLMVEYDKFFPGYDFANSKGYPSKKHMDAIIAKGPCQIHRKTFKRVKEYLTC